MYIYFLVLFPLYFVERGTTADFKLTILPPYPPMCTSNHSSCKLTLTL